MGTVKQGLELDEDIFRRLQAQAKLKNQTSHSLMRAAIEADLEREENSELEKHGDRERWEDYLLTGDAISHASAGAWLGRLANGEDCPHPK